MIKLCLNGSQTLSSVMSECTKYSTSDVELPGHLGAGSYGGP